MDSAMKRMKREYNKARREKRMEGKEAHFAGLKVAHFRASPSVQPVKRTKLRTQVSRVTTLIHSETLTLRLIEGGEV